MAKFQEVFMNSGVDESKMPTGMIVPLGHGKFNTVRLTGATGLHLKHPPTIAHEEVSGIDFATFAAIFLSNMGWGWGGPLPSTFLPGTKYFKISGTLPGVFDVTAEGSRGPEARLKVAVLKPRPVKLAICPIQVRSPQGGLVYHSKEPFNVNAMVDQINSFWTPQANVVFTLVSQTPVPLTNEAEIGNLLGKSLGPAFQKPAPLPDIVNIDVLKDLLIKNRDTKADLTMFLVQWCSEGTLSNTLNAHGVTDWREAISLISDWRAKEPALMAHEAGHFLGKMGHRDDEVDANSKPIDNRKQLMDNAGGSLFNLDRSFGLIPFDLVISRFNKQ